MRQEARAFRRGLHLCLGPYGEGQTTGLTLKTGEAAAGPSLALRALVAQIGPLDRFVGLGDLSSRT